MGEEPGDAPRRPHRARGLVHGDDRSRAEHRAGLADLVLVEGKVELVGAEPVRRRAAGDERLKPVVAADAAAARGIVEEVAKGGLAHLDLVVAGPLDVARHREDAGARRTALTQAGECRASVEHDPRDVRHRLDVVDDGGRVVEAVHRGEVGGLDAGKAPLALEALEQPRLVAADVGAGARVHHDVD